jgi:hypothetical protein
MKLFRPPRRKGQKPDPACQSLWLVMSLPCIACRTASLLGEPASVSLASGPVLSWPAPALEHFALRLPRIVAGLHAQPHLRQLLYVRGPGPPPQGFDLVLMHACALRRAAPLCVELCSSSPPTRRARTQVTAISGDDILIHRLRALAAVAARSGSGGDDADEARCGDATCDRQAADNDKSPEETLFAQWAADAGEEDEEEEEEGEEEGVAEPVAEDGWLAVRSPRSGGGGRWSFPAIETRNGVIYKIDKVLTPGILVKRQHDLD